MARKYALLVATSKFDDDRLKKLHAPDDDVTQLRELLKDKSFAGFDDVGLCLNSSIGVVQDAVADLFAGKADDDLVLFYYSGHGLTDTRGRLYFALPDTNIERPSAQSLGASFVRQHMDDSGSSRQILMLDCCHSGAFMSDGKLVARNAENAVLKRSTFDPKGHGRFVLSASAASESSFERDGKSIYTQTLVDGLRSGDIAPEKKVITVTDVHNYLSREVKGKKAPQRPQFWADGQTAPLIISKNPNVIKPIDQDIIDALTGDSWLAQKGAISELEQIARNGTPKLREKAIDLLQGRVNDPDETNRVANAARAAINRSQEKPDKVDFTAQKIDSGPHSSNTDTAGLAENKREPKPKPASVKADNHVGSSTESQSSLELKGILVPVLGAFIAWTASYMTVFGLGAGSGSEEALASLFGALILLAPIIAFQAKSIGNLAFSVWKTGFLFVASACLSGGILMSLGVLSNEIGLFHTQETPLTFTCMSFGLGFGLWNAHFLSLNEWKKSLILSLGFAGACSFIVFVVISGAFENLEIFVWDPGTPFYVAVLVVLLFIFFVFYSRFDDLKKL